MEYRDDARIDTSHVRRGGGGGRRRGGGIAIGGVGGLAVVVLVLLFGNNLGISLSDVIGEDMAPQQQAERANTDAMQQCRTGADIEADRECRWPAYVSAIEGYWDDALTGYEHAPTQLFSGQVATACGTGSSEMGPFYCPGDTTVYLDTQYLGQLLDQLGAAGGDAAEAYVLAHEYGHHVSNLTGSMRSARDGDNTTGPASNQVRLELQADCYAGVFFANTVQDPTSPIRDVTRDDLARIVGAARAVGDDHIQQRGGGRVVPESWTHGSSEMRQRWVLTGFDSGDANQCDTFSTDDL